MTVGIYAIYSVTDGACLYVGQSKHIEARFRQHVTKLKNRRTRALPRFVEWYHAHGALESLLHLVVLEECADDDLVKNELEAFWFDELNPRFYGKAPSFSETWTHTPSAISKISEGAQRKAASALDLSEEEYQALPRRGSTVLKYSRECALDVCSKLFSTHKRSQIFCSPRCGRLAQGVSLKMDSALVEKLFTTDGLSLRAIAKTLGFNKNEVRYVLVELLGYNLTTRARNDS